MQQCWSFVDCEPGRGANGRQIIIQPVCREVVVGMATITVPLCTSSACWCWCWLAGAPTVLRAPGGWDRLFCSLDAWLCLAVPGNVGCVEHVTSQPAIWLTPNHPVDQNATECPTLCT